MAAVTTCQALFQEGLATPQAVRQAGRTRVAQLLAGSGYDGCGEGRGWAGRSVGQSCLPAAEASHNSFLNPARMRQWMPHPLLYGSTQPGQRTPPPLLTLPAPPAEDKTAGFLVDDAAAVQQQYGGDLRQLRTAAGWQQRCAGRIR